jgi:hypothetical protein
MIARPRGGVNPKRRRGQAARRPSFFVLPAFARVRLPRVPVGFTVKP